MCPDWLALVSQECVGVELVRVHCSLVAVFYALPRHGMMTTNRDLRKDVVFLYGYENVVRRDFGGSGGSRRVAKGIEEAFASSRRNYRV
jgi:hypothetical protein